MYDDIVSPDLSFLCFVRGKLVVPEEGNSTDFRVEFLLPNDAPMNCL